MASQPEPIEDESFIILGTTPGTSLDLKCSSFEHSSLDKVQLDDALKDMSAEASMALKAHLKLGDCPSPGSLMAASSIITEDRTTADLQKQFGELLDENLILKETLQKNNESMKKQFLMIASCQEDMMRTHVIHKEKFDETRELVEKLRQENKKLRQDISQLTETESQSALVTSATSEPKSGPSSALEFVTSPEDDTINKLTAQLELVEKQRRQVIVENEKLTWQKESLENIVDATSKEREDLKEKIKELELKISAMESEYEKKIHNSSLAIEELNKHLLAASTAVSERSYEAALNRDETIMGLNDKVAGLQSDLKTAQLRILDLENVKLEFTKLKSGMAETIKMYKEQIQDLHNRLKEAQTTMFQPVRFSISSEGEAAGAEHTTFVSNVKLYDKALKHFSDLLNMITHGASDSLVQALGVVASLQELKLDRSTTEQFRLGLAELRQQLDRQHSAALNNIGQVRGTLTIFEGIFKDYNELLKKSVTKQKAQRSSGNVEVLSAALVARGQELQAMENELRALRVQREDTDLLKAQLDLYKSDFDAEREAREKMASEKENILADLRGTQRRNQELLMQLEEVRKLNPNIFRSATSTRPTPRPTPQRAPPGPEPTSSRRPSAPTAGSATGNMVYTCPKCMRFSSDRYKVMEDHFDLCLDDFI